MMRRLPKFCCGSGFEESESEKTFKKMAYELHLFEMVHTSIALG